MTIVSFCMKMPETRNILRKTPEMEQKTKISSRTSTCFSGRWRARESLKRWTVRVRAITMNIIHWTAGRKGLEDSTKSIPPRTVTTAFGPLTTGPLPSSRSPSLNIQTFWDSNQEICMSSFEWDSRSDKEVDVANICLLTAATIVVYCNEDIIFMLTHCFITYFASAAPYPYYYFTTTHHDREG